MQFPQPMPGKARHAKAVENGMQLSPSEIAWI
jgi:hypothetical protein